MSYNVKNYTEQGGEKTVIGGTLEVLGGATVKGITGVTAAATESTIGGIKAAAKDAGDTVEVKIGGDGKLYVPTYPVLPVAATTQTEGIVKQAANVALASGETVTVEEFNNLIGALVSAGLMATKK